MTDLGIRNLFAGINGIGAARAQNASRRSAFKLRQTGDRCRDRRDWQRAREHYGRYLEIVPEDAAIWVQYGHMCKELGDRDAAETAYRKSIAITPAGDSYLWLGRLLKAKGDVAAAGEALRKAIEFEAGFDLDAELGDGQSDVGQAPSPPIAVATVQKRVLIDLSDVLLYLREYSTVSGIQRVQLGLADALLRMMSSLPYQLAFVARREDDSGWVKIDDGHLETLVKKVAAPVVDHQELVEFTFRIEADGFSYRPAESDLFLILGAFWSLERIVAQVPALRRAGATLGVLVHDLIPVTNPEFCEESGIVAFRLAADIVFAMADWMVAVSEHTARALRAHLAESGLPERSIATLRLAHHALAAEFREGDSPRSPAVATLSGRSYVLYVSTIEIRKNHLYLFQVWKRLRKELGEKTPTLVLVGQKGWLVSDLFEQLKSTNFLGGTVRIVNGLSDPELAELYRNCLFTVYPSFEEGWGLPVGESLTFGRPCLAARASSLPEVAGDFVDYFDPFNVTDGYQKIRQFIVDAELRETRAAAIRADFKPRLWHDVAADLLAIIDRYAARPSMPQPLPEPPQLRPGEVHVFGHGGDVLRFVQSGRASLAQAMCDANWHGAEDWGCWMRGPAATLVFRLSESEPREIVLVLELQVVAGFQGRVRVNVGEARCDDLGFAAGTTARLIVRAKPQRQTVRIAFASTGQITTQEDPPRSLSIGVRAIGYAPIDDLAARLSLLETLNARVCDVRQPVEPRIGGAQ